MRKNLRDGAVNALMRARQREADKGRSIHFSGEQCVKVYSFMCDSSVASTRPHREEGSELHVAAGVRLQQ